MSLNTEPGSSTKKASRKPGNGTKKAMPKKANRFGEPTATTGRPKGAKDRAPRKPAKTATSATTLVKGAKKASGRPPTVHFLRDNAGEFRWNLMRNGRKMADSGEGYATKQGAQRAWDAIVGFMKAGAISEGP